jgi:hypothetical protein
MTRGPFAALCEPAPLHGRVDRDVARRLHIEATMKKRASWPYSRRTAVFRKRRVRAPGYAFPQPCRRYVCDFSHAAEMVSGEDRLRIQELFRILSLPQILELGIDNCLHRPGRGQLSYLPVQVPGRMSVGSGLSSPRSSSASVFMPGTLAPAAVQSMVGWVR